MKGVNVKQKKYSGILAVLIGTRRRTATKTSPKFEDQPDILTNLIFFVLTLILLDKFIFLIQNSMGNTLSSHEH